MNKNKKKGTGPSQADQQLRERLKTLFASAPAGPATKQAPKPKEAPSKASPNGQSKENKSAKQVKSPKKNKTPEKTPPNRTAQKSPKSSKTAAKAVVNGGATAAGQKRPKNSPQTPTKRAKVAEEPQSSLGVQNGADSDEDSSEGEEGLTYSNSDEHEFEEDEEEEEEDDEVRYSDFDEDDFEEDDEEEDFFSDDSSGADYETDDDDYEHHNGGYDFDYQLPPHIPEDLIIHRGTAEKRPLLSEDEVEFDSDIEDAQIVELSCQKILTSVEQPSGYSRDVLDLLNQRPFGVRPADSSSDSDPPKLVPIVLDADGFQRYSGSQSDSDSCYELATEDSDASCPSEDVNSKYLESQDSTSEDEPQLPMSANIIDATAHDFAHILPPNGDVSTDEESATEMVADYAAFAESASNAASADRPSEVLSASVVAPDTQQEHKAPFYRRTNAVPVEEEDEAPRTRQTVRSVCCNAYDSNRTLMLLKEPVFIYGTVKLSLIAGAVDVYGYEPQVGEEVEIFSPRGCCAAKVAPLSHQLSAAPDVAQLTDELMRQTPSYGRHELDNLLANFEPQRDALISLRRNVDRKQLQSFFKKYMSENIFPNMNSLPTYRPFYSSEFRLRCFINTEDARALRLPAEWTSLQLRDGGRVVIAGGKGVGKSTLLRYLLNRHLRHGAQVLLIDLDIGQPELFVPQTVSCTVLRTPLLGPGFCRNDQPDKAFLVGHTNPVLCATAYLRAVRELLAYCRGRDEYARMPWLVNTMGYNKGFGMELMAHVCAYLQPTDVVQLQSNKPINNYDELLTPSALEGVPPIVFPVAEFAAEMPKRKLDFVLHVWESAVRQESRYQRDWSMSPKDMRYAIVLARLSAVLSGNKEWITDCQPLIGSFERTKIVDMSSTTQESATQEELLRVVEANLVYLCDYEKDSPALTCVGIGIVRGVDFQLQQIYINPAFDYGLIASVNCLAIGEMPLPSSLFLNQGPKVKEIAPYVYNTIEDNATRSVKQIFHRPAEFLKGKRKRAA